MWPKPWHMKHFGPEGTVYWPPSLASFFPLDMCWWWKLFWLCMGYFGYVVMVLWIFRVWMYEYFGVGLEIWEEVAGIFPRFLRWLPKHHLSLPSRCFLEICHLVIDNLIIDYVSSFFFLLFKSLAIGYASVPSLSEFLFVIFQMNLNPWAGCEGYAECEQALELNGCWVLFECGHGKYWYLGDRVLP